MKMKNKKMIGLSLFAAMALQVHALGETTTKSLGEVDVVATSSDDSYVVGSSTASTKLDLSIKHTPQAVIVLTKKNLEDRNIKSYQELLINTAGISLDRWDERLSPSARGFVIDYYKIDGMPTYVNYSASDPDLFLFEKVEIVKGANGLTTGSENPSTSINFVRKRATSKELKGNVNLNIGSWNSYGVEADVMSKVNESGSIRARVVAKYEDSDSFRDKAHSENKVLYGVVDADLSDTTYLSVGASYQELNKDGIRWGGLPAFNSDGTQTNFSRSTSGTEDWTYWNTKTKSVFANLEQYLKDDISLNVAYSYDEKEIGTHLFYLRGALNKSDGSGIDYLEYLSEDKTEETNLDINLKLPFELDKLSQEIVLGVTYNENARTKNISKYPNGTSAAAGDWGRKYIDIANFYNYDLSSAADQGTYDVGANEKTEQIGTYLAGNFSLFEELKLIAGARVSSWKYSSDDTTKATVKTSGEITPYLGLVYDIDANHTLYTSYTEIFKTQTYKNANGNYLDPVVGKSYEAGAKGEYFDGNLISSVSIFKIIQDNVGEKIDGVFVPGTTTNAYRQIEGITSKGVEVDVAGNITKDLSVNFGFANFEAKDAKGNKVSTRYSRNSVNIFTKYTMNDLSFGAGLNYKSRYYLDTSYGRLTQKAFTVANIMAAYKINKNTNVQVNIDNLFDKTYYEAVGTNRMIYGDPVNATATLKYTF